MEPPNAPVLSPASEKRIARHIANLADVDDRVAQRAERCLIRFYGARALAQLLSAADNANPAVRFRAAYILGLTKDRQAFPTLLRLLHDPDGHVRYDACIALGHLQDPRSVAPLFNRMSEEDPEHWVDTAAATALQLLGTVAVRPLISQLRSAEPRVRVMIVSVLGGIGDPVAVESLEGLLEDPDFDVRAASVEALEEIRAASGTTVDSASGEPSS